MSKSQRQGRIRVRRRSQRGRLLSSLTNAWLRLGCDTTRLVDVDLDLIIMCNVFVLVAKARL